MNSIQQRIAKVYRTSDFRTAGLALSVLLLVGYLVLTPWWLLVKLSLLLIILPIAWMVRLVIKEACNREIDIEYLVQVEHIVEASKHPEDYKVFARAQMHRELLKEAKNPYGVKVLEIIFQEGEYTLESWEEFEQRKAAEEAIIIKERHKTLRNRNRKDYLMLLGNQDI